MCKRIIVICLCAALPLVAACDDEGDDEGADDSEQVEQSEEAEETGEDDESAEVDDSVEADEVDQIPETDAEVKVEPVIRAEWEEIDDAFRYVFELDGDEIGTAVGGSRYFAGVDSLDALQIRGETMDGDDAGETELVSTEDDERLVLRWNEEAFDEPFLGRLTTGGGTLVLGLQEMPHVMGAAPDDVELVVLGEKMEQGGSVISAPFEFDDDSELVEHGPFVEVALP